MSPGFAKTVYLYDSEKVRQVTIEAGVDLERFDGIHERMELERERWNELKEGGMVEAGVDFPEDIIAYAKARRLDEAEAELERLKGRNDVSFEKLKRKVSLEMALEDLNIRTRELRSDLKVSSIKEMLNRMELDEAEGAIGDLEASVAKMMTAGNGQ